MASSPSESSTLHALMKNGCANGVEGLRLIDRGEIRKREPHVEGYEAIEVPSTSIVSSEDLVKAYARIAADRGAHIVTNARVGSLESTGDGVRVTSSAGEIDARCLVNSAGLFADEVAGMLESPMAQHRIYPVRGEYCEAVRGKQHLIRGLVYPLPHADGLSLGMHLTKTVTGSMLIGPTAHYVKTRTTMNETANLREDFAAGAKTLLPEIEASDLVLAYSGIRAKLFPPADPAGKHPAHAGIADFIIQRDPDFPRVVQLMGIDLLASHPRHRSPSRSGTWLPKCSHSL